MKKKICTLLAVLSALALLMGLTGCAGGEYALPRTSVGAGEPVGKFDGEDEYVLCGEQKGIKLFVNPFTTGFYVENTRDGSKWYSSPVNAEEDWFADGLYKMEMLSNLVVYYTDGANQTDSRFNTYTDSVLDGNFTIQKLENGFTVEYRCEYSFTTLTLNVYLRDGDLVVEVPTEKIKVDNPDYHITDIAPVPFFGAGGPKPIVFEDDLTENEAPAENETPSEEDLPAEETEPEEDKGPAFDEGYLFVADGSGALINFNNGKGSVPSYQRPVFGLEPTREFLLDRYDLNLAQQNASMPVFGIRRNEAAFVAVIENGAAVASICAKGNMQQTSFANAYAQFRLREILNYKLGNIKAPVYETGKLEIPSLSVRYRFLAGSEADYNGMARSYRAYLTEKYRWQAAEDLEPALYLELYGGVSKQVSRLGFQFQSVLPLTTTGQVQEIVDILKEKGVSNVVVSYRNWNKDDLARKSVNSAAVAGNVNKGSTKFKDLLVSKNMTFYPALYELTSFDGGGLKPTLHGAADISGVAVRMNRYAPGIGTKLPDSRYYFTTALELVSQLGKTADALQKKNFSRVSLSDVGNQLFNDYRDGNVRRENVQFLLTDALKGFGDRGISLMLSHPNVYALPYAAEVFAAPTVSSGQDLLDEEVPFYNMVLSGIKRYSAAPLNNSAVGDDGFLKALETGSMAAYTWIYEEASAVKNTPLSFLSSSNYRTYVDEAAEQYKVTAEIAEKAGSGAIYRHDKIGEGVYCLTYETGLKVYVNYEKTDYTLADGQTVGARSWLLTEGGN